MESKHDKIQILADIEQNNEAIEVDGIRPISIVCCHHI